MKPEQILCLGDIAGYYCLLNECIDVLRERPVIRLLGNHDYYLATGTASERSRTANLCLEYQAQHITEDRLRLAGRSIPAIMTGRGFQLCMRGWDDPLEEYIASYFRRVFREAIGWSMFCFRTHACSGSRENWSVPYTVTPAL